MVEATIVTTVFALILAVISVYAINKKGDVDIEFSLHPPKLKLVAKANPPAERRPVHGGKRQKRVGDLGDLGNRTN